ncbi:MAG TPA: aldo/keto reductase [Clostridiales bacterium]|nr:aldo/keto reductase [Clostridiales bacterium]
MEYIRFGNTGIKVSQLCLGMLTFGNPAWRPWILDEEQSRPIVKYAVDNGINYFDTGDTYSGGYSEIVTGKFIKEMFPGRRDEVVVSTKVYEAVDVNYKQDHESFYKGTPNKEGLSRKRIFHAIDNSLQRLGMDYVDIYQMHYWDYNTPIEETMEALHDVVKAGKARYIGASNTYAWQLAKAQQVAKEHNWTQFVSMQSHYNLVYREEEREVIPLCIDQKIAVLPWSPLARGFLAGNRVKKGEGETIRSKTDNQAWRFYYRDSDFAVVDKVTKLADEKGVSNAAIAYAWLMNKPGVVTPLIGVSKLNQLDQAFESLGVKLTPEEMLYLEEGYEPHPILGHV